MPQRHRPAGAEPNRRIFIAYASPDLAIAEALNELLLCWGLDPFYCRDELVKASSKEPFRKALRERLIGSALAIVVVSREFKWSSYCQAEAGTIMAAGIPRLLLRVPPVIDRDIESISPVFEGFNSLDARNKLVDTLASYIDENLRTSAKHRRPHVSVCDRRLKLDGAAKEREASATSALTASVERAESYYRLRYGADVVLQRQWPSLDDPRFEASLKGNIADSLRTQERTRLTIVGVSLKFSLNLIGQALSDYGRQTDRPRTEPRRLELQLVHMDDWSHILHTLDDRIDLGNIRSNFYATWTDTVQSWRAACNDLGIELNGPTVSRIDYMPPRVGILINDNLLYAGRCAVTPIGAGYKLEVGENEYALYTADDSSGGAKRIGEFKKMVNAFGDRRHNSGWLVADHNSGEWILELQRRLRSCGGNAGELLLISNSGMKFTQLITPALENGFTVRYYVQKPSTAVEIARIKELKETIRRTCARHPRCVAPELRYFWPPSTFRAAVVGNDVIGLQMYVPLKLSVPGGPKLSTAEATAGQVHLDNSPLRVVLGSCSVHFDELRKMIDDFIARNVVTPKISAAPSRRLPQTASVGRQPPRSLIPPQVPMQVHKRSRPRRQRT